MVATPKLIPGSSASCFYRILVRVFFFAFIWLVLCNGDSGSWFFGLPTIAVACWVSLQLAPPEVSIISLKKLITYIPFFIGKSILSSVDVMRRAVDPRLPIDPGLLEYPLSLPKGGARVFLVNSVSLLPGTISADLAGDSIIIHTLDKNLPIFDSVSHLERLIADLYRVELTSQNMGTYK